MSDFEQMFPQGEPNDAFAQYFVGQSYLAPLASGDATANNVTFEPGCRNNWHTHPHGQLLVATSGTGYYQEKGQPARLLRAGDVMTGTITALGTQRTRVVAP